MSSQAMDLVCCLTQKNLFLSPAQNPGCWIRIWLRYKWPTCDQWKYQLSPLLYLGPILIRAQSSFVRAWAYTDAFLPAWLTDLWLLKLQPFTRIQMVSSQAKYGPSLHLLNWPLAANLNEFQLKIQKNSVSWEQGNLWWYDITRILGAAIAALSPCLQSWEGEMLAVDKEANIQPRSIKVKKIWKDLDLETCLIMVASGWSAQIWQRLSIFPTKGFYHLRANIFLSVYWAQPSVLGIILTSSHCVVLPLYKNTGFKTPQIWTGAHKTCCCLDGIISKVGQFCHPITLKVAK